MIGQVPASVEGPVADQDLLIPSGNDDGKMKAISRNDLHSIADAWSLVSRVVGIAWESSSDDSGCKVIAYVGPNLGNVARVLARFEKGFGGFTQGFGPTECPPWLAHQITDIVSKLLPQVSKVAATVTSDTDAQRDAHTMMFSTNNLLKMVDEDDIISQLDEELARGTRFLLRGLANELNDSIRPCLSSDAQSSIEAAVHQILAQLGEEVHNVARLHLIHFNLFSAGVL